MNPKYSIYIPSKGRHDTGQTKRVLDEMGVPYKIVVEPQEYEDYAKVVEKDKILVLPFSNLGEGSIPARNWIWEYSKSKGEEKHWIIDDNILRFYRLNRNKKVPVGSGTIFRCAEIFTDRYKNVAFSGLNNIAFAHADSKSIKPYSLNTRIYSMTLINNELPYRWRGKYNEDTDICLRALKDDWCTIQFNAFLGDKVTTLKMKGGNTDNVYTDGDKRLKFAQSLAKQHPDIVKVTWKYNRWHHQVDYSCFKKNKLIKKEGLNIPKGINNYGMELVKREDKK